MIAQHHPTLPPSSYPAWAKCPHWEARTSSDAPEASIGTAQHALLSKAFKGEIDLDTDEDIPNDMLFPVRRAYNGILRLTRDVLGDEPDERYSELLVESNAFPESPFGTLDYVAVRNDRVLVLDYKSFATEKEHWEQIAFYACAYLKGLKDYRVTLAVWYGDTGTYDLREVSESEARDLALYAIANRLNRYHLPRTASAWCSLCANCGACQKALDIVGKTNAIIPANAEDLSLLPAERLPLILTVCAEAKKRIKAVEDYAKQVALFNGGQLLNPDGTVAYEIKERKSSEIEIQTFYDMTKDILTPPEILGVCKLPKTTAKTLLKTKKRDGKKLTAKAIDELIDEASVNLEPSQVLTKVRRKED